MEWEKIKTASTANTKETHVLVVALPTRSVTTGEEVIADGAAAAVGRGDADGVGGASRASGLGQQLQRDVDVTKVQ